MLHELNLDYFDTPILYKNIIQVFKRACQDNKRFKGKFLQLIFN